MKAFRKGLSLIFECIIGIEILIFIGVFPILFANLSFHLQNYLQAVYRTTIRFFTFQTFTYDGKHPLFPIILDRYLVSIRILGLGFITACILAFIMACFALFLFRKRMGIFKKMIELAESVPDLIFILLLQMLVIFIYRKTGILIALVVTLNEQAILLPVIGIAVPISFYITKIIILYVEEELEKDYIILAKSKGFSFFYILNRHVLQNIAESLFGTSKTFIWSMLSSLLIIEKLFNINGLFMTMFTGTDSFIIGCVLIFLPFFILYRLYDWLSFDYRKDAK